MKPALGDVCTRGPVAPVHQFVLSLNDGAQFCRPVAVLLLVHEEVDALPHQVLLCATEHVLVAQQHLQHRGEAVSRTCQEKRTGARGSNSQPTEAHMQGGCMPVRRHNLKRTKNCRKHSASSAQKHLLLNSRNLSWYNLYAAVSWAAIQFLRSWLFTVPPERQQNTATW